MSRTVCRRPLSSCHCRHSTSPVLTSANSLILWPWGAFHYMRRYLRPSSPTEPTTVQRIPWNTFITVQIVTWDPRIILTGVSRAIEKLNYRRIVEERCCGQSYILRNTVKVSTEIPWASPLVHEASFSPTHPAAPTKQDVHSNLHRRTRS